MSNTTVCLIPNPLYFLYYWGFQDNYSALMLATLGGFTDTVEVIFRLSKPALSIRTTVS